MEDILASIRRILNEGEGEGEAAPAEVVQAEATPTVEAIAPVAEPVIVSAPEPPVVAEPAIAASAPQAAPSVAKPAPEAEVSVAKPEKETQSASTTGNEPVEVEDVFILDSAMMVADTAVAEPANEAPIASNETMAAASQSVGALKKALSERQAQVYKAACHFARGNRARRSAANAEGLAGHASAIDRGASGARRNRAGRCTREML